MDIFGVLFSYTRWWPDSVKYKPNSCTDGEGEGPRKIVNVPNENKSQKYTGNEEHQENVHPMRAYAH